ncbi:MAG TPA: transposase [Candidatus Paceibacterota bacterium]|mgnify:FL=1|jgi:REP element-mobilizing transposase RayT|nr:MAG: Transposase IS200 like protein [Verrucomicrobia bacterium ADurb.Bin063]HQJ49933.1 transposase [Verrucomicrobiota bacterium]HRD05738.1 transposase [Verrucomicrobiota bacterium]HRY59542.1 transposase [Candidatus Paceibacterota bacterium]HRZ70332.1 transposase [Candidatus Paceibacterota bacterium]
MIRLLLGVDFAGSILHHCLMPEQKNPSNPAGPRGVVPYNPGLYALVEAKNRWQDRSAESKHWNQRGYLPHRDAPGLTQFVTFRLADSFPAALRSEWETLLKVENNRARALQWEAYLDKGRGACHLRRPAVAKRVEAALRFFQGGRYELLAWVVMPNHVHVLFRQREMPLGKVVGRWKSYTAREANRILGRKGPFWNEDYWDTYMRDEAQEKRACRYIENNPVKARLVREPGQWPWSSARFRDAAGRLQVPP